MSDRSPRTTDSSSFQRITVASDGSPGAKAAVGRAARLAAQHGADLCLLQACDPGAPHSSGPTLDERVVTLGERLAGLASLLERRMGLQVESVVEIGPAHVVIGEHVQSQKPSLLVLGSRFDPATAGLGGTAMKVLHASDCQMLVVRTNDTRPCRNILSAVDLRDGSVRAAVARPGAVSRSAPRPALRRGPGARQQPRGRRRRQRAGAVAARVDAPARRARELGLLAQGLSAKSRYARCTRKSLATYLPARCWSALPRCRPTALWWVATTHGDRTDRIRQHGAARVAVRPG